jgi:hypothetical protein
MKSSEDTVHKGTEKKYLIAQEFMVHCSNYYIVKAETMGEAIALIELDEDVLPIGGSTHDFKILGYSSEDNFDS